MTLSEQVQGSQHGMGGGRACSLSAKELLCYHFHEAQADP